MNIEPGERKEFKKRNDYSCVAWRGSTKLNSMKFVNKITDYSRYLKRNNLDWRVINVYARRSGRFLIRYYKDDIIPDRPSMA